MDDNKAYLEAKQKEFQDTYIGNDSKNEWNILRSQINSGLFLGLNYEQIDKYAIVNLNYEQREIIKFAMYTKLPDEHIESLIKSVIDNNANEELLLKEFENYRFVQYQDVTQIEKYQQLCEMIKSQASSEELQSLNQKVADLEILIKDKDAEIAKLKSKYDETIAAYEKALQMKGYDPPEVVLDKKEKIGKPAKKKGLPFFKKKFKEYGSTKLPDDFNFVKYLSKKKLSSSQLELITVAVKLNVSESAIYDIVESGAGAEEMKQMIETHLAQQEQAKNVANSVPIDDYDCFH